MVQNDITLPTGRVRNDAKLLTESEMTLNYLSRMVCGLHYLINPLPMSIACEPQTNSRIGLSLYGTHTSSLMEGCHICINTFASILLILHIDESFEHPTSQV